MRISRFNYPALLLPLLAIFFIYKYMTLPGALSEWDYKLILFLCFISILERILVKFYTPLWFSFFIVVLGLLIFDINSIFYSLFYFGTGFLFANIRKKGKGLLSLLSSNSIGIIAIIAGNEYYNQFAAQTYWYRYLTFIFLLLFSFILAKLHFYLEFKKSSSTFISMFLPILFKLVIIFPVLSFYDYFNNSMITIMFLFYLYILYYCRKKFLSISETHIQELMDNIKQKEHLDIFFMELGTIKGVYYPRKKIIAIDRKLDYPEQLQTIVHEYLHHRLHHKLKHFSIFNELIVTLLEAIFSWAIILKAKRGITA